MPGRIDYRSEESEAIFNQPIQTAILGGGRGAIGRLIGTSPSVVLVQPKFAHNVGAAVRAASCFGIRQVWYTGDRFQLAEGQRLPREERMKGYRDVDLIQFDYPLDQMPEYAVPVAVEVREGSEPLHTFMHPEHAVYVFGPEDGSLGKAITKLCHRFVVIPTYHCVNLAAAVYMVLYDRMTKLGPVPDLTVEGRGFYEGR